MVDGIFPLFSCLKGGLYSDYKYLKLFGSSGQIFFSFKIFKHPNPEVGYWGTSENPIRSLIHISRHLIAFKNVVPGASENWSFCISGSGAQSVQKLLEFLLMG